jgi:hypothetical protein
MKDDSPNTNSTVDRRRRRLRVQKDEGSCTWCPPHDVENRGRRPRPDTYKSRRKGR